MCSSSTRRVGKAMRATSDDACAGAHLRNPDHACRQRSPGSPPGCSAAWPVSRWRWTSEPSTSTTGSNFLLDHRRRGRLRLAWASRMARWSGPWSSASPQSSAAVVSPDLKDVIAFAVLAWSARAPRACAGRAVRAGGRSFAGPRGGDAMSIALQCLPDHAARLSRHQRHRMLGTEPPVWTSAVS